MSSIKAWAAPRPGANLEPFTYEAGPLGPEEVEIAVEYCGICHTDLSFIDNEAGNVPFPLVPGHEITGRIIELGEIARNKGLSAGQRVGIGWFKETCGHCEHCLNGEQQLCESPSATIWGNHGGFSERVRTHWMWAIPVPEELNAKDAGPLFCAGITVFSPMMEYGLRPTDRVGVFGIGGLGHLAIQFAHAFGSEVTAFTSNPAKTDEVKKLGADHVVSSRSTAEWDRLQGRFDLLVIAVGVPLDWEKILLLLSPGGRLHFVSILYESIPVAVFPLMLKQRSVSASPAGSRGMMDKMLRFAARHRISPAAEHFPMSQVNAAIAKIKAGKAAYRVILDADF